MRIIFTIDYSPWSAYGGGAQRSNHNLAVTMAKRGHDVHVINTKPPHEYVNTPKDLPYTHHWVALPAFVSKRDAFFRVMTPTFVGKKAQKIMASYSDSEPLIVHSNGEEGGRIHRLHNQYRFGFISTPRHPHYPDTFFRYPFDQIPLIPKIGLWLHHGKYLMQASAARHADFVCPPSRWAANTLAEAFDIQEEKLHPVPNGVPAEFLNYHRKKNANNGPIVFFGRLSKTKGVDTLVEALAHIGVDKLPDVFIIGRGELKTELQTMVENYGLNSVIQFKPWMSHDELGEILSQARMAVLPSREENFSLAILGAMCVGTPTISTKVGGTPEIIQHRQTGLLVEAGNHRDLAEKINLLLDDRDLCDSISQAASTQIREQLTWDDTADRFEELYQKAWEMHG